MSAMWRRLVRASWLIMTMLFAYRLGHAQAIIAVAWWTLWGAWCLNETIRSVAKAEAEARR